jgi:hypothetical protein
MLPRLIRLMDFLSLREASPTMVVSYRSITIKTDNQDS